MAKLNEEDCPPLAALGQGDARDKDKSTSASGLGLNRHLKVSLAMTGERIAEIPEAAFGCKLSEVIKQLRDTRPLPLGLDYQLAIGETMLQPDSFVGDLEGMPVTELQAHVQTVGSIALPGLTGAAELPESGDIIVASTCAITSSGDGGVEAAVLGPDDGPSSYMWIWRLKKSHGYALQHAVLLTRRQCYSTEQLQEQWQECVKCVQSGREDMMSDMAFSKDAIEKTGQTPEAFPHSNLLTISGPFVQPHSEKYVLLAWNPSCYVDPVGVVDRLDTETGEVECVARIFDLWKAVSSPDGTVFCSTCYSGFTVSQLHGTTVTHPNSQQSQDTNLVVANIGPAFDFDPDLFGGALVAPCLEGDGSILVALPPETDKTEALKLGAEEYDSPLDPSYPPGDKSKPWQLLKFPAAMPAFWMKGHEFASMAFASKAGKLMSLDAGTHTVHIGSLGESSREQFAPPRVPSCAKLTTALDFSHAVGSKRFIYSADSKS
eukprot:TRINITY_DN29825_c0_g1_i1.p1 TRINITY_DN29825_c0_g1~~TRINITY_DN29825_c0_g1_i1.p1  ORF type:complete len:490 (+),score=67.29 TRINITY_DN29825_c0_g1_i1:43-1512(+)